MILTSFLTEAFHGISYQNSAECKRLDVRIDRTEIRRRTTPKTLKLLFRAAKGLVIIGSEATWQSKERGNKNSINVQLLLVLAF